MFDASYLRHMDRMRKRRDGRTWVYRLYDSRKRLLYVGLGTDWRRRVLHHRRDKCWGVDIFDMRLELYPTRQDATWVEAVAILNESPLHNLARYREPLFTEMAADPMAIIWQPIHA